MKRFLIRALLKSLGVALFIIILTRLDWGKLFKAVFNPNGGGIIYLLFSILLVFPLLIIKSFRWRKILQDLNINIDGATSFRYFTIGLFAGSATPGQLGDFIKTIYLNKKGFPGGASFFSVLYDRIFDIITLSFILFGGLVFLGVKEISKPLLFAIGAVIVFFMILFLISAGFRRFIAVDIFKHFLPRGIKNKINKLNIKITPEEYQLKKTTMLSSFAITIIAYGITFYRYYLLLLILGLSPPFYLWFGAVTLSSFVTLLPISISGIGTRDAILIVLFQTVDISAESAVAFSMLILLLMVVNGILGLILWMKNPLIPKTKLEIN